MENKKTFNKTFWILISIGLAVRLVAMAGTYFGDLFAIHWAPNLWVEHGIFTIYSHATAENPDAAWVYYPPLMFFTTSAWQWVMERLGFDVLNILTLLRDGDVGRVPLLSIAALKLPYLVAEVLFSIVVLKNLKQRQLKYFLYFWVLNPVIIYYIYTIGQYDILPALCVLLAVKEFRGGKNNSMAFWIGMAAAFKIFPVVFAALLILNRGRTAKEFTRLCLIASIPIIFSVAPFLMAGDFAALKSFFVYPGFSGGGKLHNPENLIKYTVFFGLFAYFAFQARKNPDVGEKVLINCQALFFAFLLLITFNGNYTLWVMPFFLISETGQKRLRIYYALYFGFLFLSAMTFYAIPTARTLTPLIPQAAGWPGIADLCKQRGITPVHKIFKLLMKLTCLAITVASLRMVKKSEDNVV